MKFKQFPYRHLNHKVTYLFAPNLPRNFKKCPKFNLGRILGHFLSFGADFIVKWAFLQQFGAYKNAPNPIFKKLYDNTKTVFALGRF